MLWLTCDMADDRHTAVLNTLTNWVPAAKARGKKVVLYGVNKLLWRQHAGLQDLVSKDILRLSLHRVCHRPLLAPEPLAAPSSVKFVVFSTGQVQNQLCRCKG